MKEVSLNFGAIRDTIFVFSSKELVKEGVDTSETMNSFLEEMKNSPTLKLQHLVFKNLENGHFEKERLAERYIAQNMKLMENVSWNDIMEENKQLRKNLLKEHHVEGSNGKGELYESIHTLIESTVKKGYTNIDASQKAFEFVLDYLTREKEEITESEEKDDMPEFFSWRYINELAVNNFNDRYSHLNESERELLSILLSSQENKENYLEDIKNENFSIINNLLKEGVENTEAQNALSSFKEKLENLPELTQESIDDIIINCTELNLALKEF